MKILAFSSLTSVQFYYFPRCLCSKNPQVTCVEQTIIEKESNLKD